MADIPDFSKLSESDLKFLASRAMVELSIKKRLEVVFHMFQGDDLETLWQAVARRRLDNRQNPGRIGAD